MEYSQHMFTVDCHGVVNLNMFHLFKAYSGEMPYHTYGIYTEWIMIQ